MIKETPYGKILLEVEGGLLEHACRVEDGLAMPYSYNDDQFRACLMIFMTASLWKLWEKLEGSDLSEKADSVEKFGRKLRELILEFTGIDSYKLF